MDLATAYFLIIAVVATGAGVMVILARNAVHSALFLVVNLFCVALLYLSLRAEFLAAVQVMVYAGAIVVLFLFVITLLNPGQRESLNALKPQVLLAVGLGVVLLGQVLFAVSLAGTSQPAPQPVAWDDNVLAIGRLMFTDYLFPFELMSILLLIALVGATVLAKGRLKGER